MTRESPVSVAGLAFIDGSFDGALSGATFDTFNPATGTSIASIAACDSDDVDRAVAAARRAFDRGTWRLLVPGERKAVLLRLADLLELHAAELALLDTIDAGKPISDTTAFDVPDAVATMRWFAESIDKWYGRTAPTHPDRIALITREPYGVVGAVIPWNYPLATLVIKIAPALAAGNSVVVKPSELSPLSALRLAELAAQAGIPPGVLNVVPGSGETAGRALGLHKDVAMLTFTGSTEVGRQFLRYSADSNLKAVTLEMGGKSPQVVLADCRDRLGDVARELATAAFVNMGENCTSGSRILVDRGIQGELEPLLVQEAEAWTVGDPQDPATRIGPLIEQQHLERVEQRIADAVNAGARVLTGGCRTRRESGGWFLEPTILTRVDPDMAIAREEVFGPVVCVLGFDSEREAIQIANGTDYGLAASLYTDDLTKAHRMSREILAGTVSVNCYSEGDLSTPFGGIRMSGLGGRERGIDALEQYSYLKTTWISVPGDAAVD